MKYGESAFDILYLIFAVGAGVYISIKAKNRASRLMGLIVLALGVGDAFHLVPRVLNYFVDADYTKWLGVGKLVTSLTMTLFYEQLYYVCEEISGRRSKAVKIAVELLFITRIVLCVLPYNAWLKNDTPLLWGILRNVPFAALGALDVVLFFKARRGEGTLRRVWLWAALSFAFYIPVVVGASAVPMLGMLMLPKTVCYVFMIIAFIRYTKSARVSDDE